MPEKARLKKAIEEALNVGDVPTRALGDALKVAHPSDVAEVVLSLKRDDMVRVFLLLPASLAGAVLEEADEPVQLDLLEELSEEKIADIIDEMPPDKGADVLELLAPEEEREVLGGVEAETAESIKELRSYDPETAGGIMTTEYASVGGDATIDDALAEIRQYPEDEPLGCVYVTDDANRLKGVVTFRQIVHSSSQTRVKDIMITDVVSVKTTDDQEHVAREVQKYNYTVLPVVDENNVLKGMVAVDDVMDVVEEEASEDMYRMAGTYVRYPTSESTLHRALKRLPFLLVTLCGGFVSAFVLASFQHTIHTVLVLVSFIPVMAGMAGNVGVQSATVVVRGLALGDIDLAKVGRVLGKEIGLGILVGIVCGGLTGFVGAIILGNPILGVVVAVSMITGITVAAALGTAIPLLCQRIRIDPAIASGPFITTLNDITGLTIYLSVATMLLSSLAKA